MLHHTNSQFKAFQTFSIPNTSEEELEIIRQKRVRRSKSGEIMAQQMMVRQSGNEQLRKAQMLSNGFEGSALAKKDSTTVEVVDADAEALAQQWHQMKVTPVTTDEESHSAFCLVNGDQALAHADDGEVKVVKYNKTSVPLNVMWTGSWSETAQNNPSSDVTGSIRKYSDISQVLQANDKTVNMAKPDPSEKKQSWTLSLLE